MKIYAVVSIDTECDRGYRWRNILPVRYDSVTELIPGLLQKLFSQYRVKPSYLLSPEVLLDNHCVQVLKQLNHVELGAHLHGEFVEPGARKLGDFQDEYQAMYPFEIEKKKLENLSQLFTAKIGVQPRSFRAGRWGMGPKSLQILEDLGYWVDSSITPYFNWDFPSMKVDYKTALDVPYFPSRDNYLCRGDMGILQVPVTIVSDYGHCLSRLKDSAIKKALLKLPLWRPQWLRPTYSHYSQMKSVIDRYLCYHQDQEQIVLNMMFHSVEILPQDNPYGFDSKRISRFLDDMKRVFEYLQSKKTVFVGLSELYPIFQGQKDRN